VLCASESVGGVDNTSNEPGFGSQYLACLSLVAMQPGASTRRSMEPYILQTLHQHWCTLDSKGSLTPSAPPLKTTWWCPLLVSSFLLLIVISRHVSFSSLGELGGCWMVHRGRPSFPSVPSFRFMQVILSTFRPLTSLPPHTRQGSPAHTQPCRTRVCSSAASVDSPRSLLLLVLHRCLAFSFVFSDCETEQSLSIKDGWMGGRTG